MTLSMRLTPLVRATGILRSPLVLHRGIPRCIRYLSETTEQKEPLDPPKSTDPEGTLVRLKQSGKVDRTILQTIENLNFRALTKVQDESIVPSIESEKGIVVRAKTGTGKTLAFLIPILNDLYASRNNSLKNKHKVFHLVIAPTRDLAQQIERELTLFCKGHPELKVFLSRVDVLTGSVRSHLESLFSPSIVIATPGRLIATLEQTKRFGRRFRSIRSVTLDEADRLLDKGFGQDLARIDELLRELSVSNQNGDGKFFKYNLYSATIDENVSDFAKEKIDNDYKYIDCVEEDDTEAHENITQVLVKTDSLSHSIHGLLAHCIKKFEDPDFKGIYFLPTINAVEWVFDVLKRTLPRESARKVFKVNGKMTQAARDRNLLNYRRSKGGILVCTDVAARGLDFPDISTVIQATCSSEVASYVHKIGRTGRAGKSGEAYLFSHPAEEKYLKALNKEKQIEFNQVETYDSFEEDRDMFKYSSDEDLFEEAILSLCLFYSQVSGVYNINKFDCLKSIHEFYQEVTDLNEKITLSKRYLDVLFLPRAEAEQVFNVPKDYRGSRRQDSKARFNRFDNQKTSNFNGRGKKQSGFNRERSYGGNRSNDRYNDRSNDRYNNRSNDRFNNRSNDRFNNRSNDRFNNRSNDRFGGNKSKGDRFNSEFKPRNYNSLKPNRYGDN